MKRNTEKHLQDVIQQQLFSNPNVSEEVASFSLDHPVIGYLKKENVEKRHIDCVLDADEHGVFAVNNTELLEEVLEKVLMAESIEEARQIIKQSTR